MGNKVLSCTEVCERGQPEDELRLGGPSSSGEGIGVGVQLHQHQLTSPSLSQGPPTSSNLLYPTAPHTGGRAVYSGITPSTPQAANVGHGQVAPVTQLNLSSSIYAPSPAHQAPSSSPPVTGGGLALEYPDGSCYRGQVVEGTRHGQGEWTYIGGRYSGSWKSDLQDGEGVQVWDDGRRYIGQFSGGKFHGKGRMEWTNEHGMMVYEGSYLFDRKEGYGSFLWPDGRLYEGQWRDGKRHGRGAYTNQLGVRRIGDWTEDKLLQWVSKEDTTAENTPHRGEGEGRGKKEGGRRRRRW